MDIHKPKPFHSLKELLSELCILVIGIIIAWDHGYIFLAWLKTTASILLAIFLWWLVLLGVNVHVH